MVHVSTKHDPWTSATKNGVIFYRYIVAIKRTYDAHCFMIVYSIIPNHNIMSSGSRIQSIHEIVMDNVILYKYVACVHRIEAKSVIMSLIVFDYV